MACEYGPTGAGACSDLTLSRTSGGLHDLVGSEAARADAKASDSAVHHRPDSLKIWDEATRPHVVGVADRPAHNGPFTAEFATFCHGDAQEPPRMRGRKCL